MIRLNAIVEGQTEETFFNTLLCPHLAPREVYLKTRCVTTGRKGGRAYRGCVPRYEKVKRDINFWLREDASAEARFTTMFDFYRLPNTFPGFEAAKALPDPYEKVRRIEEQLAEDIGDWISSWHSGPACCPSK